MPWTCLVKTCDSNTRKQFYSVSTFKVPDEETEKELYDQWLAAIPDRTVLKKNHRICEKHFRTGQIIKEYVTRTDTGEFVSVYSYKHPRLVKGSIPCLFAKPGQTLDSHIYNEHAYVTKSLNFSDETSNPSEEPCRNKVTELPKDGIIGLQYAKLPNEQILNKSAATAIFQSVTFDFDGTSNNPNAKITLLIDLIKPWNAARVKFGDEEYLLLSHIVEAVAPGKKTHALEKAVLISKDRTITYEIYGRPCDIDLYKLPKVLEHVSRLTDILKKFKDLPICEGAKIFNTNFLTADTKTLHEQPWRPDNCTLISLDGDKCPGCQKQTIVLSLKNDRKINYSKLPSISPQSNPLVQKKVIVMENKTKHKATLRKRFNMLAKTGSK